MLDPVQKVLRSVKRIGDNGAEIYAGIGSYTLSIKLITITKLIVSVMVIGGVTAAAVLAFAGFGSQSALAMSISATDIEINTSDGSVTAVTIEPDLTYSWDGVDDVQEISTTITISNASREKSDTVYYFVKNDNTTICGSSGSDPDWCGNTSATVNKQVEKIDITDPAEYSGDTAAFSTDDFNASDGQTKTTTVYVTITVQLGDENGKLLEEEYHEMSFDVTVTNSDGDLTVTGALNTNATTPVPP